MATMYRDRFRVLAAELDRMGADFEVIFDSLHCEEALHARVRSTGAKFKSNDAADLYRQVHNYIRITRKILGE